MVGPREWRRTSMNAERAKLPQRSNGLIRAAARGCRVRQRNPADARAALCGVPGTCNGGRFALGAGENNLRPPCSGGEQRKTPSHPLWRRGSGPFVRKGDCKGAARQRDRRPCVPRGTASVVAHWVASSEPRAAPHVSLSDPLVAPHAAFGDLRAASDAVPSAVCASLDGAQYALCDAPDAVPCRSAARQSLYRVE